VDHSTHGDLVAADRTTRTLGDRAVVVAEPSASLRWTIDREGDAVVDQPAGEVFYRVERGGTFVVHTPAADIHVTGTCFRVEVAPMNKQLLLSAAAGAAIATAVVVTVYEGHVLADSRHGERTELAAGDRITLSPDGKATVVAAARTTTSAEDTVATREQLVARSQAQQAELSQLRVRIKELEDREGSSEHRDDSEPGRAWYDPSKERLAEWAKQCHIRVDEPGVDNWQASTELGKNSRGLEPNELAAYNAALAEVQQQWKQLVRALYIEATGDTAGAETLSTEAMRREIEAKGGREDGATLLREISAERAGLAQPPADLSATSPLERLFRAWAALGEQTEQALAKRVGAQRAKALRGDGWDSHSDMSGCPESSR
jgi:hypothetical protein